jgi:hypothetical protein
MRAVLLPGFMNRTGRSSNEKYGDKPMYKTLVLISTALIWVVTAIGCTTTSGIRKDVWPPLQPRNTVFYHTVAYRNETMPIVAAWYTGSGDNAKLLAEANPKIDAKDLKVGDHVFISLDLLKSREPLTQEFITDYLKKLEQEKEPAQPVVQPAPPPAKKKTTPKKRRPSRKKKYPAGKPSPKTPPKKAAEEEDELELFGPK